TCPSSRSPWSPACGCSGQTRRRPPGPAWPPSEPRRCRTRWARSSSPSPSARSPAPIGLIVAAAALVALFVRRSARHPSPVIELHLLRRPTFATATAANVVFGTAFGAMLLLVTLWCQDVWGWSALRTGLGVAPGPLLVPFWAIAAGPLARRIGPGPVAAAGRGVYAG